MNSSLIGKIEKARRYSDERQDRISFEEFVVNLRGDNGTHQVRLKGGILSCNCDFYTVWSTCSHTMTMERILTGMVPEQPVIPNQ